MIEVSSNLAIQRDARFPRKKTEHHRSDPPYDVHNEKQYGRAILPIATIAERRQRNCPQWCQ